MDEFKLAEDSEVNKLTKEQEDDYKYAQDSEVKQSEILDRNIFTLSSVFIGIVIGFMKEIKTLPKDLRVAMLVTVFLFLMALLFTLGSYAFGIYQSRCHQRDALRSRYHNLKMIGFIGSAIRIIYCTLFLVGVLSLFYFFYLSLVF